MLLSSKGVVGHAMISLRRFIAIVLLIVFVPVSVMAGPMRLCLGQDGHRAVELAHGSAHHINEDAPVIGLNSGEIPGFETEAVSTDLPSCIDLNLMSAAIPAAQSSVTKLAVAALVDIVFSALPVCREELYEPPPQQRLIARQSEPRPAPQLAVLRTVILLI